MNTAELDALTTQLSNEARVIYLLGLCPIANPITGQTDPLNYKTLMTLVNSKDQTFTRGRQLNGCIKELAAVGLVSLYDEQDIQGSLNGKSVVLPLLPSNNNPIIKDKFVIHSQWEPDASSYSYICVLIGLIDTQYSPEELGEFIAYWQGRPDVQLSDYQWTQRFCQQVKRQRSTQSVSSVKQTGLQTHQSQVTNIEADDNAKRLVAKYKQSKHHS